MSENIVSKIKLSNNQILDIAVDSSNILNAVPQFAVFTRMDNTCLPYYMCNKPLEELSTPQLGIQHYECPITIENDVGPLENLSIEKYSLLISWKPQNKAGQPHYVFDNLETTINDLDQGRAIARDNNVKVTLEFTPEYSSEGVLIGFNTQYPQNVIFNWEYEDTVSMGDDYRFNVNPCFELPTGKVSINNKQYTITNTRTTEFSGCFYVVDEEDNPAYLLQAESSDNSLFELKDFPNNE